MKKTTKKKRSVPKRSVPKRSSSPKRVSSANRLSITCECGESLQLTTRNQKSLLKTLTADTIIDIRKAHFHHGGVVLADRGLVADFSWPRKKLKQTKSVKEFESALREMFPALIEAIISGKTKFPTATATVAAAVGVTPTTDDRTWEQRSAPMTAEGLVELLDAAQHISDDVKRAAARMWIERAERSTAAASQQP